MLASRNECKHSIIGEFVAFRRLFTIDLITLLVFTAYNFWAVRSIATLAPFFRYFQYIVIAGIIAYIGLNWLLVRFQDNRLLWWGKYGIIFFVILATIIVQAVIYISIRHQKGPVYYAHDSLIQNELAVRFVLSGENPYEADFSDTPLAQWPFRLGSITRNPALTHYAYLPLTFLLPLPIQFLAEKGWGWFDQRILFLIMFTGLLATIPLLSASKTKRALLLITLGLTPFYANYVAHGRNDVLVVFWIVLCIAAAKMEHVFLSVIFLSLSCSTKHFAFMFVPFYFLYLSGDGSWDNRLRRVIKPFLLFIFVTGLMVVPWLIQNPLAFYQDVIAYIAGTLPDSYPINGMGFSVWLLKLGILNNITDRFPFGPLQITFTLITVFFLLRRQLKDNTLNRTIFNYGISLGVLLFFSVAFNDNYLGYLFVILSLGFLIDPPNPSMVGNASSERSIQINASG